MIFVESPSPLLPTPNDGMDGTFTPLWLLPGFPPSPSFPFEWTLPLGGRDNAVDKTSYTKWLQQIAFNKNAVLSLRLSTKRRQVGIWGLVSACGAGIFGWSANNNYLTAITGASCILLCLEVSPSFELH